MSSRVLTSQPGWASQVKRQAAEEALAATGAAVTVPAGIADAVPVVTLTTGGAVAMEDMDVAQN